MEQNYARVVLLAGQSNAAGVARQYGLEQWLAPERFEKLKKGFETVPFLYWSHYEKNADFEPVALKDGYQTCDVAQTFGPEIGFAEYISEVTDETIYLVKWALGGSSLFYHWNPTVESLPCLIHDGEPQAGMCFGSCLELLETALPRIREISGKEPKLEALLWMQGEEDACNETAVQSYMEYFHILLSRLKNRLAPYISDRFCVIDAGISAYWSYHKELNARKRSNAEASPRTVYLDTIAAELKTGNESGEVADVYHYDSRSMMKLGRMFAAAYWEETH